MSDQTNILVVDDDQTIRDGCSRILSKSGWRVIAAENGQKGLDEIRSLRGEIDVVLLDLMMPGLSGMEVLEQSLQTEPDLLVIVITGYATVESAVEAMKRGAYDFIAKPFTPDQLRIVVKRALERRALQKEAAFLRQEREKSLRDIATEKSKIKTIIHSMGDGVLVCDQDGSIVLTNPAANRMLQLSEDRLLGKLLAEAQLPSELASAVDKSLKMRESTFASISQELSVGPAEEVHLRAHTAPVRNDVGEIMGAVTVLQDMSYLKELDKMKSEFIAMVAHELRAPIAAIEQQLTVILNKMAGDVTEKQEQLLSRAKERTKGLLDLIKDLLDLSKIEAGKMVQYKEPLSLDEVIQRVVDLMRAEADHKKIDLQFIVSAETALIHADRNSMEEIFTNLISNAIKYTPEKGSIRVALGEERGFVKASVSDTGIGIEEESLPRIFDRFYRVKTKETRQIVGTGLGLSIVKSIVASHLGSISVESKVGTGTTFTILLPKESASE
ncbi:MAG TPA: ATP-binding protein [Thermodesulfobacteriota bacterium]|nr:ATP-binding protein [Thermodesulfobacteriota bacterium]